MATDPLWKVVGQLGIIVRQHVELDSSKSLVRLATGSLVRELERIGERLHYEKIQGEGPVSGWVTIRLRTKELLVRVDGEYEQRPEALHALYTMNSLGVHENFPVGSSVRIVKNSCMNGKEGRVVSDVQDEDGNLKVVFDADSEYLNYMPFELELIKTSEASVEGLRKALEDDDLNNILTGAAEVDAILGATDHTSMNGAALLVNLVIRAKRVVSAQKFLHLAMQDDNPSESVLEAACKDAKAAGTSATAVAQAKQMLSAAKTLDGALLEYQMHPSEEAAASLRCALAEATPKGGGTLNKTRVKAAQELMESYDRLCHALQYEDEHALSLLSQDRASILPASLLLRANEVHSLLAALGAAMQQSNQSVLERSYSAAKAAGLTGRTVLSAARILDSFNLLQRAMKSRDMIVLRNALEEATSAGGGVNEQLVSRASLRLDAFAELQQAMQADCARVLERACEKALAQGVPSSYVAQAQLMACCIDKIMSSMTNGDFQNLQTAIDDAVKANVSRVLIARACSWRDAAIKLEMALAMPDQMHLEAALASACDATAPATLISTARQQLHAYALLQEAMKDCDCTKLKIAQDALSSSGIPVSVRDLAKALAGALATLNETGQSEVTRHVAKACALARSSGVQAMLITEASGAMLVATKRKVAERVLRQDMQGEDVSALAASYQEAMSLGLCPALLAQAASTKAALSELQDALQGEDAVILSKACQKAAEQGITPNLVARAERRLVQRQAEHRLFKAITSIDAYEVEQASLEAAMAGVAMETIKAAQARAELSHKLQSSCVQSADVMETVFSVGRTDNHVRLTRLLGKVLAQHNVGQSLQELVDCLRQKGAVIAPEYSRVFRNGGATDYGLRGGRPYFKPFGFVRYGLHVGSFDQYKDWCVAYHGTMESKIIPILLRGLKQPGTEGVIISHGQAYSHTQKTIYLSPALEYASHPVYAQLFAVDDGHWAQLVFQCRVRPGAFVEKPGSLRNKHWPNHIRIDPNWDTLDGLEWLLEDPNDVVVTGLLVREFGPNADAAVHGSTATAVTRGVEGPEFEWTRLRALEFQQNGLLIKA